MIYHRNLLKTVNLIVGLFAISSVAYGQGDLDRYLEAGTKDAGKMVNAYVAPVIKGFGYGLNNGWYNTAKAHKTLGFDLTISATAVSVPSSEEFFTFVPGDYENLRLADGESDQIPTAFGPSDAGPELILMDPDDPGSEAGRFRSPGGMGLEEEIGINAIPVPVVQLGIGVVKNTDLKFRFIPSTDFGDGEIKLFGIGVMHDVKQWIPGIKAIPFDLSVLLGYTKLTASYDMSGSVAGEDQESLFIAKSTTLQAIISKKISVLTVYGALGYNAVDSDVEVNGTYTFNEGSSDESTFKDPVAISIEDSSLRATAGFRLKLAILTLHADYTLSKYPMATAGIGFAVR